MPRYDCRPVDFVGAILASAGLLVSAFANDIYVTYLAYGMITGELFSEDNNDDSTEISVIDPLHTIEPTNS